MLNNAVCFMSLILNMQKMGTYWHPLLVKQLKYQQPVYSLLQAAYCAPLAADAAAGAAAELGAALNHLA